MPSGVYVILGPLLWRHNSAISTKRPWRVNESASTVCKKGPVFGICRWSESASDDESTRNPIQFRHFRICPRSVTSVTPYARSKNFQLAHDGFVMSAQLSGTSAAEILKRFWRIRSISPRRTWPRAPPRSVGPKHAPLRSRRSGDANVQPSLRSIGIGARRTEERRRGARLIRTSLIGEKSGDREFNAVTGRLLSISSCVRSGCLSPAPCTVRPGSIAPGSPA